MAALLSGCTHATEGHGFSIRSVEIRPGYQRVSAEFQQQLALSAAAGEALENGVPLSVQLELELRDSASLALLAAETRRYEIRYLPLNRLYQLTSFPDGRQWAYPRLRHVLAELADLRIDVGTGPLPQGDYEFRARIRLDTARLPAPLHLPAFFSADWRHDSEWTTWPFEISA